jgi:hypothetical protein
MIRKIPLVNGGKTIVDYDDFKRVENYSYYNNHGYAARKTRIHGANVIKYLHREITNAPKGFEVHHIDGNPLNNCKINLIIVTPDEHLRLHNVG